MQPLLVCACCILPLVASPPRPASLDAKRAAKSYVKEVDKLNREHLRKPGGTTEDELAGELPAKALAALDDLLAEAGGPETLEALLQVGEAALELARVEDFDRVRARMMELAPGSEAPLGVALAKERFLLRGLGGLDVEYLEHFAAIFECILEGYDEVFGFAEFSKVPGKKLRVHVHLEPRIERPPHFAPEFPYHSQIDFPVIDARKLSSPTADGKFLFYGLCHELGHVIAMWGRPGVEEDHHAWAHYTGVVLVEHLAEGREAKKVLKDLQDVRWRSLEKEREAAKSVEPGFDDRARVLAFLIALHDEVGPKAIGDAINLLDAEDKRTRFQQVRYYTFEELRDGLEKGLTKKARKDLARLWPR